MVPVVVLLGETTPRNLKKMLDEKFEPFTFLPVGVSISYISATSTRLGRSTQFPLIAECGDLVCLQSATPAIRPRVHRLRPAGLRAKRAYSEGCR
jgi:hypothetical protein